MRILPVTSVQGQFSVHTLDRGGFGLILMAADPGGTENAAQRLAASFPDDHP